MFPHPQPILATGRQTHSLACSLAHFALPTAPCGNQLRIRATSSFCSLTCVFQLSARSAFPPCSPRWSDSRLRLERTVEIGWEMHKPLCERCEVGHLQAAILWHNKATAGPHLFSLEREASDRVTQYYTTSEPWRPSSHSAMCVVWNVILVLRIGVVINLPLVTTLVIFYLMSHVLNTREN